MIDIVWRRSIPAGGSAPCASAASYKLKACENGIENVLACLGPLDCTTLDTLSVLMQEKGIQFIEQR
jgi:hypothetical protein